MRYFSHTCAQRPESCALYLHLFLHLHMHLHRLINLYRYLDLHPCLSATSLLRAKCRAQSVRPLVPFTHDTAIRTCWAHCICLCLTSFHSFACFAYTACKAFIRRMRGRFAVSDKCTFVFPAPLFSPPFPTLPVAGDEEPNIRHRGISGWLVLRLWYMLLAHRSLLTEAAAAARVC